MEFYLFSLVLLGVALFHKYTMYVALAGLTVIVIYKYVTIPDFNILTHIAGSGKEQGGYDWGLPAYSVGFSYFLAPWAGIPENNREH